MSLEAASIRGRSDAGSPETRKSYRSSRSSTLNHAVEGIANPWCQGSIALKGGGAGGRESGRFKVVGAPVTLAIGTVEAQAQAKIEGQALGDSPVVLEIGLHDLVAVIILRRKIPLMVIRDISHEQVGESVPRTHRSITGIKG